MRSALRIIAIMACFLALPALAVLAILAEYEACDEGVSTASPRERAPLMTDRKMRVIRAVAAV